MQGTLAGRRAALALAAVTAALVAPQAASAAIDNVFGGDVGCQVQADGSRYCSNFGADPRSTTKTFDGVPIDVNVAFPPAPASGPDGGYPLVMIFHGYGGDKLGLAAMQPYLDRGYAAFSMTDRGFHESCGSVTSRAADPTGCAAGYVRLMDTRYEVRDAQELAGSLVDQGLVDPRRIGATGASYGGGMSMALAALRNRMALEDGTLAPWRSPGGTPMRIAGAAANIPWTDLAYSLTPNGSTLDYVADAPYQGRIGVMKESLVNGLYVSGLAAPGFYAPVGADPSADLTGWKATLDAGEPYGPSAQAILDQITANHSSYYIDDSTKPAPLLISNGFTDDLFPGDEAVRYYNRTRAEHPKADIALFFGDFGHPRAQNKPDVAALLESRQNAWLDHYVAGTGAEPAQGAEAMTQTCPESAPSGGPFRAKTWARMGRGEVRIKTRDTTTIAAGAGDPAIAREFDPVTGGGACAQAAGADQPGTATYRLDPAPAPGYTLLGSPTVIARFTLPGETSQVAARLLDVGPDGLETLVARGLWRPATGGPKRQVFQLHPNGWHFAEGHVAKLELLPADAGGAALNSYGRASNDQQDVTVSGLELRLPVRERPGALAGLVTARRPPFVPDGYELAADFDRDPRAKLAQGRLRARGSRLAVRVKCPVGFETCARGRIVLEGRGGSAGSKQGGRFTVAKGRFTLDGGERKRLRLKLTRRARNVLDRRGRIRVTARTTSAETVGKAKQSRTVR